MPLGEAEEIWYTVSKEPEGDEVLETRSAKKGHLTKILAVCLAVVVIMLAVLAFVSFSCFEEAHTPQTEPPTEAPTLAPTETPTEEPTEEPSEAPTEPPLILPEEYLNPYGQLDFQYEGRYLKCLRTKTLTAVDVSSHQQQIDWNRVKASGVDFAMIRIGYRGYESGKLVTDPYAQANLTGAAEAGIPIGVYFFSQALSVEEAQEEAAFVLELIRDYNITMPVVYDWETVSDPDARTHGMDARTLTDCSLAFLQAIEEAGYTPMLYFNSYQSKNLLYLDELTDYDFWLAMYTNRMDYPYKIKMWQYTDSGTVPGITGPADLNVYFIEE